MRKMRCAAIVLAAGQGRRMNTSVPKQFLEIDGRPLLAYTLENFQDSPIIDQIILVTGNDWVDYCQEQIVQAYNFTKVTNICIGGKERYDSVHAGLKACSDADYVFIHDGARPFVTEDIISRGFDKVQKCEACVAGMPSKDTVKIVDENLQVRETPIRSLVWNVQTPQVFKGSLICAAYDKIPDGDQTDITDDAMVVERFGNHTVSVFEGSYRNIKVTTEDDLDVAKLYLKNRSDINMKKRKKNI